MMSLKDFGFGRIALILGAFIAIVVFVVVYLVPIWQDNARLKSTNRQLLKQIEAKNDRIDSLSLAISDRDERLQSVETYLDSVPTYVGTMSDSERDSLRAILNPR